MAMYTVQKDTTDCATILLDFFKIISWVYFIVTTKAKKTLWISVRKNLSNVSHNVDDVKHTY